MTQQTILSVIKELKTQLKEDDILKLLGQSDFWEKIIPISSKEIKIIA